jgi:hypothetical protein
MALGDPYISADDLKVVLGITDDSEDALIERAVRAATLAITNRSGYASFWNTGTTEVRTVETAGRIVPKRGAGYWKLLLPDGIASPVGLAVGGVTTGLRPLDVRAGRPIDSLRIPFSAAYPPETYEITAVWGWPELPDDIIMATQMQAHRYYSRRGSPEGMAGSAEWGVTRVPNLDPDVKAILEGGGYLNPGIG